MINMQAHCTGWVDLRFLFVIGSLARLGDLDGDGSVTLEEVVGYTDETLRTVLVGRSQTPTLRPKVLVEQ